MIKIITVMFAVIASILGSVGALYLKKASKTIKLRLKTILQLNLILGLFFYILSAATVILLLKFNKMSFVYPLTALTYVFVTIISWKYLNEKINNYKIVAISLIVIGVALVAMS